MFEANTTKPIELFLTEENYSSNIDRVCKNSVQLMKTSTEYRKFIEQHPSRFLIGFPMPFRLLAESIAHQSLPTTEFRIAETLLEKMMSLKLPVVFLGKHDSSILNVSAKEVERLGMTKTEVLKYSIENGLKYNEYQGTEEDIIDFVKEARLHIRKEVFENCDILGNVNLYLKMIGKEGW